VKGITNSISRIAYQAGVKQKFGLDNKLAFNKAADDKLEAFVVSTINYSMRNK